MEEEEFLLKMKEIFNCRNFQTTFVLLQRNTKTQNLNRENLRDNMTDLEQFLQCWRKSTRKYQRLKSLETFAHNKSGEERWKCGWQRSQTNRKRNRKR